MYGLQQANIPSVSIMRTVDQQQMLDNSMTEWSVHGSGVTSSTVVAC